MLLFDNIVFASFIPQILMFLGFVHCVAEPYISSFSAEKLSISDNKSFEIELVETDLNTKIAANVFDYQQIGNSFTATPISEDQTFIPRIITKLFVANHSFKQGIETNFSLFSRPPPMQL